ncbi:MAG: phosphatidate cytidylyltransferase [Pseudomonadota bacterium]|nr:phosphatidate cytidylyltransferase [Pseudomonadota bacterium]
MGTRLLAGLAGLAVVVPILVWGGPTGVWWLMLPFLLVALDEYVRMAAPELPLLERIVYLLAGLAVVTAAVHATAYLPTVLALLFMAFITLPMFARENVEVAARQAQRLGFGLVYVPILMAPLALIRMEEDGLALILFLLASTWLGDTGAYFAGRAFGKTPLFPRVSPKKTREGVLGGLLLAVTGAAIFKGAFGVGLGLSWPVVLVLAAVLDVAGVVGDLVESMFKRAFGVKDSGTIMPGHGGILDRIDSLLFTGPLLWAVLQMRPLLAP